LFYLALGAGLVACVLAAVHHAEVVAHRAGEPFGTLILALAVTVIEVALIVSLMLTGELTSALARNTIFSVIMIKRSRQCRLPPPGRWFSASISKAWSFSA
jgi:Ca2+:H+ antiporter